MPAQTMLGPGERILDETLLTQIQNLQPLSPGDLLKVARFYQGSDDALANHLVQMAVKVLSKNLNIQQTTPPLLTKRILTFAAPAAVNPASEWQDQLEDFLNGAVDAEDSAEKKQLFRTFFEIVDVRWLPFSASLPGVGLLIDTTNLAGGVYIVGIAPDPNSLSAG